MKFEVINAGKCMLCGKPIELEDTKDTDKLPDIFFCRECEQKLEEDIAKTVDGQNDKEESENLGDYPDTIYNQFDNMTGSMNL